MESSTIAALHNEVFEYLHQYHKAHQDFRYTLRKSDKNNRLSSGYYFYGNDHYLAVSFWSGTDWKNRTPNIIFVIVPGENKTFLEISVGDSEIKRRFITDFLEPEIDFYSDGKKFFKDIPGENHIDALDYFINNEKHTIDKIVADHLEFFGDLDNENRIGFIPEKQFSFRLKKAIALRERVKDKSARSPINLRSVSIENFSGIAQLTIPDLPGNTQWIFITGANGTGKSSILRALGLALYPYSRLSGSYESGHYRIDIGLEVDGVIINIQEHAFDRQSRDFKAQGFAAYGTSRLIIGNRNVRSINTLGDIERKQHHLYSLFHNDGILLDFASEINKFSVEARYETDMRERLDIIIETLIECIQPLENIIIEKLDDKYSTLEDFHYLFTEKDSEGNLYLPVTFNQLSSGSKSLVAMLGDMMVRLFMQQPLVYDLAELKGIVLIDEIDIHFHPAQQKQLIETLTESFPKIQFIVTTHSPIPLLGAPKDSVILRTKRNIKTGVTVDRIDLMLNFEDLLPNTILTSPIFGLQSIIPNANDRVSEIRTESNWKELKLNNAVKAELTEIYNRLNNDQ